METLKHATKSSQYAHTKMIRILQWWN